jgi:hypothetical protein
LDGLDGLDLGAEQLEIPSGNPEGIALLGPALGYRLSSPMDVDFRISVAVFVSQTDA